MFASQHHLDNLNLIVDNNKISMLGFTDDIVSHNGITRRLQSFGWDAVEIDGHDVVLVRKALLDLKGRHEGKPKALVAHTVKGRGVPGLENVALSHILAPKADVIQALLEDEK